jgi:putative FmdB family regulatory protein
MPTYVYFCSLCGDKEIKQKITEKPLQNCPDCGSMEFKKKFVPAGVHFKGNGFYSTDKDK